MIKFKKQSKQEIKSIRDNYSRGEIAKEILKGLAIGGVIIASFALPNLPQMFALFGAKNPRERYKIKRNIQNLKKKQLINIYEKDGQDVMEITEKGKKRVLKYEFEKIRIARPKKWDGYWHVITFDIPEKFKRKRDALTAKLNDMEVYPIQKSVFICPFECKDEIDFIGEIFNIRKFIHYFIVKELDDKDSERLKKYYNLIKY